MNDLNLILINLILLFRVSFPIFYTYLFVLNIEINFENFIIFIQFNLPCTHFFVKSN